MWMRKNHLEIAPPNKGSTAARFQKLTEIQIVIDRHNIDVHCHLIYLGVVFVKDMRMVEHVKQVTNSDNQMGIGLARIMRNMNGLTGNMTITQRDYFQSCLQRLRILANPELFELQGV